VKINPALVMHKDVQKYTLIQLKFAKLYFVVMTMYLEKLRRVACGS